MLRHLEMTFDILFSVNYPVIHVLRISEEAEKPIPQNNQQKNAKSTVNLAKPLSLHEPKSVAFVEASGCDPNQKQADKSRHVQLASIKLHQSTELGPDVYLMQGMYLCRLGQCLLLPIKLFQHFRM